MGSASSKPEAAAAAAVPATTGAPISSSSGGCPVQRKAAGGSPEGCPVQVQVDKNKNEKNKKSGTVYNVYSQPIDSTNQMPSTANQLPAPQQTEELSTNRVKSNIPRGNTNQETWTYPSPQMFYNALVRKGKLGETTESDIDSVVALHNNMNERTWGQVQAWEQLAGEDDPKLLKFIGKPSELSPKARLKHYMLNHPLPFDRHDWTVQRKDGTTVRYIIDYYHDDTQSSTEPGSGMPTLTQRVPSLMVDVRPAIDRPQELMQRALNMPRALAENKTNFEPLPFKPSESLQSTLAESMQVWDDIQKNKIEEDQQKDATPSNISEKEATALASTLQDAGTKCRTAQDRLQNCTDSVDCQHASLDLTRCLGKLWCPLQHDALVESLTKSNTDDTTIEVSLERLSNCVGSAHERAGDAREAYPSIFATTTQR